MQTHTQQASCLKASSLSCQEATSSVQQLGLQDSLWATTDTTQAHTSGSSSVASHRRRRRSKGASTWQISLKPCFTPPPLLVFASDLAPILMFTPIYWNVPSSLTHSSLAAGRLFRRYFWHTLSLNHTRQQGDYSLLSPCLSELGPGWQEMDVSNRWADPFRKNRG